MPKKIVQRTPRQVYELWIKALRSGEYKQGKKKLKAGDRFCCVGVLCDLAAKDGGPQWVRSRFLGCDGTLPTDVTKLLGLGAYTGRLYSMNDDQGFTFAQIADYIETSLLPRAA